VVNKGQPRARVLINAPKLEGPLLEICDRRQSDQPCGGEPYQPEDQTGAQ
jgi:hypothetical protein